MKTIIFIYALFISPTRQLQWSDFRGTSSDDPSVLAKTFWSINLSTEETDGRVIFTVTPVFDGEKSFTRTADPKVLSHENCHWALCCIYSHLIESALIPYQNKSSIKQARAEKIYDRYCERLRKMEDLFDKETANGGNPATEKVWETAINKEMETK